MNQNVELSYKLAKERYAEIGVDTDAALNILKDIPVSVHCWQADDVMGFEVDQGASGGILCTGNYPGRARTPEELRADLDQFLTLMPGTIRLNLHAIYRESDTFVDRAKITPEHFKNWIDWAKQNTFHPRLLL